MVNHRWRNGMCMVSSDVIVDGRDVFDKGGGGIRLINNRADFRFVPSHWETSSKSNAVSHWLGANLESAMNN